jgi:type II secretory pathway component PulF
LKGTGSFPTELLLYVENGELAGELAESMERASAELQQRAENNLQLLGTVGFICMLLFVGLLLGVTIIMMYKNLYLDRFNEFM